ncbi:hypothetical protein H4S08_000807 [Coemansia sp. RSA 1365]|nr:hypothetical protein H4S08_000807 [Coemansia sp. RSA 1365]
MPEKKTQASTHNRGGNSSGNTGNDHPDNIAEADKNKDSGFLDRVAESATRLASGFTCDRAHGAPILDEQMLSAAKSGQQQEAVVSASHMWMAESSSRNKPSATPDDNAVFTGSSSTAAASFRQAARAVSTLECSTQLEDIHGQHKAQVMQGSKQTTEDSLPTTSHQVFLAERLDGQGVTTFLTQSMPTSMGVGGIGSANSSYPESVQQSSEHSIAATKSTDPVMYLQGSTYASDMEFSDHQVPLGSQGNSETQLLQASPLSLSKSWNEHGASVLEEWQLNEAWDRAWMDTAWTSARKREKATEGSKPESVLPSNRNLSYLLKPRM